MSADSGHIKIGLVQMNAGQDIDKNLTFLQSHIEQGANEGANYILTPENSLLMDLNVKRVASIAGSSEYSEALKVLQNLAHKHKIFLHIGSSVSLLDVEKRPQLANRSLLFGPDGQLVDFYDKIHMFDVDLPNGESYSESSAYKSGERSVVADCDFAKVGMTVCYDLRFAQLFRVLAQQGAELITVPAAFTYQTGKAHWHILLQARAIETGSFIIAAAQTGEHDNGRQTFGHSLVVGPWGDILLDGGVDPGVYCTKIDLTESAKVRAAIPALANDMPFNIG